MLFLFVIFIVTVIGKLLKANEDMIIGASLVAIIWVFIWYLMIG